ncbi:MAG: flagellar hook-basal body complex protein FliE [Candidatus Krumholzibacteriia bacterium]|nr:flagellar hook-basal body complex protein FliE [bacterium]MCB9515204.1 flagellar hook-basal body complex protein FliE [Candidatus Latescibacterota bacterium]
MKDLQLRPLVTHNLLKAYGQTPTEAPKASGFAAMLEQSLSKTQAKQDQADAAIGAAVLDQGVDVHQIMIAQEEASLTFELLMEVRNRLLEGYQQLMQMQV